MILGNKSFLYPIAAAFTFSLMNACIKLAALTVPTGEIAFFRGLPGALIILWVMKYRGEHFSKEHRGLLLWRGFLGGIGMLCNFIAVAHMNLGDASILFQTTGIFVLLFSVFFLQERLSARSWLWIFLIGIAVVFAIQPWQYANDSIYGLVALGGSFFAAAAYTTIRKLALTGKHSRYEIMFYFLFIGSFVGLGYDYEQFVVPSFEELGYLLLIALLSLMAQYFLTGAFITNNAVVTQLIQYVGILFNALMGYLLFGEHVSATMVITGLVMFAGAVRLAQEKERISYKAAGHK